MLYSVDSGKYVENLKHNSDFQGWEVRKMTKEQEIMDYLNEKVFNPVLDSKTASNNLRSGIRTTIMRLNKLRAEKMVQYFWSAVIGTERSIGFAKSMKDEGFARFEEAIEEFRVKFNDAWLRK